MIRRVEDRHVLEAHDHVVRDALLGLGVELEVYAWIIQSWLPTGQVV